MGRRWTGSFATTLMPLTLLTLVGDPTALMRNIYLEPGNKLGTAASLQILESVAESINQSRIRLCWLPGPDHRLLVQGGS